jgi:hypothetical protein
LDRLNDALRHRSALCDVFDASACSQSDIESYIPGIGIVYHTPVVCLWDGSILVAKASGYTGRQIAESILNPRLT